MQAAILGPACLTHLTAFCDDAACPIASEHWKVQKLALKQLCGQTSVQRHADV